MRVTKRRLSLILSILLLTPMTAGAQSRAGWVTISKPAVWSDGGKLSVAAGKVVSISGQAYHRGVVEAVLVNGTPAKFTRASNNIVDFTATVTASRALREVVVVVKPRTGESARRAFALEIERDATNSAPLAQSGMTAGGAFTRGLLVPGLGQIATGRKPLGAALMVAGVGALGYGILSTDEDVKCAVNSSPCPPQQVVSSKTTRPHLLLGIGAYVVLAVAGAFEAKSYANKHPDRFGYGAFEFLPYATLNGDVVEVQLMRVSF